MHAPRSSHRHSPLLSSPPSGCFFSSFLNSLLAMKFGKKLTSQAYNEWRKQYIDYAALKKEIKAAVLSRDESGACVESFTFSFGRLLSLQLGSGINFCFLNSSK